METEDFVVSGTCSEQMYGMCESLWEPDMVSFTFPNRVETPRLGVNVCSFMRVEKKSAITVNSYVS